MSETVAAKRAAVISSMISSLGSGEDRKYYVGLLGYCIEGVPYSASGFSVDLTATPDIRRTDAGFACTAMFPPEMVQPATVKANGIEKISMGGKIVDLVRVRVEVMIHDISSVAEFVGGQQRDLLLDSETLMSRPGAFSNQPH